MSDTATSDKKTKKPSMNLAHNFAMWLAGRKFFLVCAYWFFCFAGACILYIFDADSFEEKSSLYNDALEWSLYGFYGFAGIEGVKEIMTLMPGKKHKQNQEDTYNPDSTNTA